MYIKLWIDADVCRVAIAHAVSTGEKISSFKKFKQAIETYIYQFGESCRPDHETESTQETWNKANDLLQKYLPETKHLHFREIKTHKR